MKLPIAIKIILNIIFYIIYVILWTLIFFIILWIILKSWIQDWTNVSYVLQWVAALIILFITIIFRKYFYIPFEQTEIFENLWEITEKNNSLNNELKVTNIEKK